MRRLAAVNLQPALLHQNRHQCKASFSDACRRAISRSAIDGVA